MKHPPYHLKANKAVDRIIFIRAIGFLYQEWALSEYTYHSLAGPFLEDVRLLHDCFPRMKCVSIERNPDTYRRQKFHKSTRNVNLVNKSLDTFLTHDFEPDGPSIFWLDYNDLKPARLAEFRKLLGLLEKRSIVKITLRAQDDAFPKVVDTVRDEDAGDAVRAYCEKFQSKYGEWLPHEVGEEHFTSPLFQRTVEGMVRMAAEKALDGTGLRFLLIHSCFYSDGTTMLSVTGALWPAGEVEQAFRVLSGFRHHVRDWGAPSKIDVPELSIKERLHLERFLPIRDGSGACLTRALKYKIDSNDDRSKDKLKQYMEHYDCYPMFSKVRI